MVGRQCIARSFPRVPQMTVEYSPYQYVATFLIFGILMAVTPLIAAAVWAKLFSPKKPGQGDAWVQFKSEYYIYAIVFLIFDVEAVFIIPFAVAFTGLPLGAAIAMLVFALLLVEGLVWAWKKGVLTWK